MLLPVARDKNIPTVAARSISNSSYLAEKRSNKSVLVKLFVEQQCIPKMYFQRNNNIFTYD